MIEYEVLQAWNAQHLEDLLIHYSKEGWELIGQPFSHLEIGRDDDHEQTQNSYLIAIFKKENE